MIKSFYKLISIFPIALSVGLMTFITAWVCMYMGWTMWISFLSWALYFLHGGTAKNGMGAFTSFVFGIILAQMAILYIPWMSHILQDTNWLQFVIPSSVFLISKVITLIMRIEEAAASYIPAVYIGTVFNFSFLDLKMANTKIDDIITDLIFPIIFGLFIGWCTVSFLLLLDRLGLATWHRRWEVK